jgi:deoxyribonucleoside regulator
MVMDKDELKNKVCEKYSKENLTQRQLAAIFNLSQTTIFRYIQEGRDKGLVEAYHEPKKPNIYSEISSAICEKYDLKDIIIFHPLDLETDTGVTYFQELGKLTAKYLDQYIKVKRFEPNFQISVAHGRSVHYTIKALTERRARLNVDPLMLIRGLGVEAGKIPAWVNAISLCLKYWKDQKWEQIIPQNLEDIKGEELLQTANRMLEKDIVKRALSRIGNSNIILQGVGPLYREATFARVAKKLGLEYYELEKMGITGSICHTPVDQNGKPVTLLNLQNLAITIPLDRLRELSRDKSRHIILIAGGEEKFEIIKTTLEGRYCNVLATDENIASRLLSDDDDEAVAQ